MQLRLKNRLKSLSQDFQSCLNLLLPDVQRRNKSQTAVTGSDDKKAPLTSSTDQLACLGTIFLLELNTQDKTPASDLRDDMRVLLLQLLEAQHELGGAHLDSVLHFRGCEALDDVVCDTAGQRVTAESGAMVTGLDVLANRLARDDGRANGDTVTKGLGGGEDVGVRCLTRGRSQRGVGVSPESTSPRKTALNLIKDQDGTNLITALAQSNEELRGSHVDTTLTLDGFHNYTACFLRNESLNLRDIIVVAILEARDHGSEGSLVLGVRGCGESAHGTAMERIVERNEFVLLA